MIGPASRWWNRQTPPRKLGAFALGGIAAGCYVLVVEGNIVSAILLTVTFLQVGGLAVSTSEGYNSWQPQGLVGWLVKRYVDVLYSIRYGRGQRMLGFGVSLTVVVLAVATVAWMVLA